MKKYQIKEKLFLSDQKQNSIVQFAQLGDGSMQLKLLDGWTGWWLGAGVEQFIPVYSKQTISGSGFLRVAGKSRSEVCLYKIDDLGSSEPAINFLDKDHHAYLPAGIGLAASTLGVLLGILYLIFTIAK